VERQMFFLVTRKRRDGRSVPPCWQTRNCSEALRTRCPAWEFHAGDLCWFINGTICEGSVHDNWKEKMESCRLCKVLTSQL